MIRSLQTAVLIAVLAGYAADSLAEDLPKGEVILKIACKDSPRLSYALYLPSSYDPEKKWPVVFGFSPGARGVTPVRLLENAAEKYGYIVVGSNDSRNGPMEPILEARAAMWKDVNARFSVDEKRCYATGFSGGARVALDMALSHHDRFAGVISCGAFYASGRTMPDRTHLVFFGLVGETCFNNPELSRADEELEERGLLHWVEEFDGGHTWPPASLMTEAVEFLELAAMRAGQIPEDPAFGEGRVQARLSSAAQLAESGHKLLALRKYRQTAKLFPGLKGAEEAAEKAKALEEDPEVKAVREKLKELAELGASLRDPADREAFLEAVKRLRELAQGGDALAARARMTLQVAVMRLDQSGRKALQRKDYKGAARFLSLALELVPNEPTFAYNLACAYSLQSEKQKAVDTLKKAVASGFDDLAHIQSDPDLENIREEAGYKEIVESLSGD